MRYLIIFLFSSFSLFGFDYHLKPYKISDGIHCFFGLPSQVNYINGGNMINSCYIETNEGYVVIDSGPTYNYAQDAYTIMEKLKKLPVKFVINTSSDEVHILGNEFYKEQGAILLGPASYEKHIKNSQPLLLKKFLTEDAIFNTRIIPLNKYLKKDTSLLLGNLNIEIKMIENDDEHLYVYLKEKKIIFVGDMIFNNRIVPIKNNRSLLVWEQALKKIAILDWINIVSSHGYMTRRSALDRTKQYLKLLKREILKYLDADNLCEDIVSKVKLPSFQEEKLYDFWHKKNVAIVCDELLSNSTDKASTNSNKSLTEQISEEMKNIEVLTTQVSKAPFSTKIKPKETKIMIVESKSKSVKKIKGIKYVTFSQAMQRAKLKKKIVLIKVRATSCKYCDQLDNLMRKNSKVKNIINKYFEIVKINVDNQDLPLGLTVSSTPTLIFIQPTNKKILMKLAGIRALGELLDVLKEAVEDGHNGGYLQP